MISVETQYAKSGDIHIAYQVIGDHPLDLVFVPGWISHVEYNWDDPQYARFLHRLASFSRLIIFDKRGTGLSDRVSELPTLEQRMDDVRAVMDAAGAQRAVIMGASEGGAMCALFAATYPQRTKALVLYGLYAKRVWSPDYPWAPTPEERQKFFDWILEDWGGEVDVDILAPSMAQDQNFRRWFATFLRRSASPGAALTFAQMNTYIDIRPVLPTIHVPTLVLNRIGDLDVNVAEAKYIADQIPEAKFVALPGEDHLWFTGDIDRLLDEVEKFLVMNEQIPVPQQVLVTILALKVPSDIGQVREVIDLFRGHEIGFEQGLYLVAFDGPTRAIHCAMMIREKLRQSGISIKAGLHIGECELRGSNLSGIALAAATQIQKEAELGEILVSSTVKDLVAGSDIGFSELGVQKTIKIAETWRLFKVADESDMKLTKRELEVLQLLIQGATNLDIARRLTLSEHTVHSHVANIYNKLNVSSRAAAVAYALQHNLL